VAQKKTGQQVIFSYVKIIKPVDSIVLTQALS